MVPIAYANTEGSDEPAHQRKIASALTAHIHNRRNIDEGACRGCEFKISKALEMIGTSRNSHLYVDCFTAPSYELGLVYLRGQCSSLICMLLHAKISLRTAVLSAPLLLEQNISAQTVC